MRPHPYLRAYMAGIVVPTMFLLAAMMIWAFFRFRLEVPSQFVLLTPAEPLERAIVFPMAFVPNLWGVWNMLHLKLRGPLRLPIGIHGSLLPIVLVPAGVMLARALDVFTIQMAFALPIIPVGMTLYYLVWRHAVGFLNQEMGIA
jgi:hypothetical protein